MAEVLGVVASGVSIVQLAGQLATSIAKLKGYWKQVKQAPSDIEHLVSEIDSLSLLMTSIQNDQRPLGWALDNPYLQPCLKKCEEGSKELQLAVEDLQRLLEGDRKWKRKVGAARVVLRNDDIKRLKRRCKSAVRLLHLALTCYMDARMTILPEVIAARLSESLPRCPATICHCPHDNRAQEEISHDKSNQSSLGNPVVKYRAHQGWIGSWLEAIVGSLEFHKRRKKHKGKVREEIIVKYHLPSLLARRVWNVAAYQDQLGWRVNLQAYRQVPWGESIFRVAIKGDLEAMKQLLSTHGGYINDRDEDRATPLHYAAMYGHHEMCQLLVSEGANTLAEDHRNWTPLEWAVRPKETVLPISFEKTIRVLITGGASDRLIQDNFVLRAYNSCSEIAFAYLTQQCFPPYHQASAQECVNIAVDLASCGLRLPVDGDSFSIFQLALKPITIEEAARIKTDTDAIPEEVTVINQMTLLHACAFRLVMETEHDIALERAHWRILKSENPWRAYIKALIVAGAEISAADSREESPFYQLLKYYSHVPLQPEGPEEVMKAWLSDLKETGVDLQRYGQTEAALQEALATNSGYCCEFTEGMTFKFGPEVEDWSFRLIWPMNDFAAQFWEMVEKEAQEAGAEEIQDERQGAMPGSWNDFDGDNDNEVKKEDSND